MDVRNCRKCGRIFNYVSGVPICPNCKDEMEKKFQEVKEYIQDHKEAGIGQISADCEVESNQIMQWVREERLVFSDDSPITLSCENCGEPIRTGRFCDKCKSSVANGLRDSFKKPEAPKPKKVEEKRDGDRMRFIRR